MENDGSVQPKTSLEKCKLVNENRKFDFKQKNDGLKERRKKKGKI